MELSERMAIALERIATALEQQALETVEAAQAAEAAPTPPIRVPEQYGSAADRNASFPPIGWRCPVHGTSKIVPAGVSARTGRTYDAFVACPERDCQQKPPRVVPPQVAARVLP